MIKKLASHLGEYLPNSRISPNISILFSACMFRKLLMEAIVHVPLEISISSHNIQDRCPGNDHIIQHFYQFLKSILYFSQHFLQLFLNIFTFFHDFIQNRNNFLVFYSYCKNRLYTQLLNKKKNS